MNNALQRIQAWRSRRRLQSLERWEQIRAEGKARFVVRSALTFGLTMIGVMDVLDHTIGGHIHYFGFLFSTIYYLGMGIILGITGWSSMEGQYRNALIEVRVNASPSGQLPPDDQASQISN